MTDSAGEYLIFMFRVAQVRATWIKNTKKMSFTEGGTFNLLDIQVGAASLSVLHIATIPVRAHVLPTA